MIRKSVVVLMVMLVAVCFAPTTMCESTQAEYLLDLQCETPFVLQVSIPENSTVVATCNGSSAGFINNGSSLIYISTSKNLSETFVFVYAFAFPNETSGTLSLSLNENQFTIPFTNKTDLMIGVNVTTLYYLTPLDLQNLLQALLIPLQNSANSSSKEILDKVQQMYLLVNSTKEDTSALLNDTALIKQQMLLMKNQIVDHMTNQIVLLRQADDEIRDRIASLNSSVVALNTRLNDGLNSLNSNIASVGGIASTISNYAVTMSGNVIWTMYSAFAILGVSFATLILSIRRRGEAVGFRVGNSDISTDEDGEQSQEEEYAVVPPPISEKLKKKSFGGGALEPQKTYAKNIVPQAVVQEKFSPKEQAQSLLKKHDLPTNIDEVLGEIGAKPVNKPKSDQPSQTTISAMKFMGDAIDSSATALKPEPRQKVANGIIQKPVPPNGIIMKPNFGDAQ